MNTLVCTISNGQFYAIPSCTRANAASMIRQLRKWGFAMRRITAKHWSLLEAIYAGSNGTHDAEVGFTI